MHVVLHHTLVEVLWTQVGIAVVGNGLKLIVDGRKGAVEGTTAKIIRDNVMCLVFTCMSTAAADTLKRCSSLPLTLAAIVGRSSWNVEPELAYAGLLHP